MMHYSKPSRFKSTWTQHGNSIQFNLEVWPHLCPWTQLQPIHLPCPPSSRAPKRASITASLIAPFSLRESSRFTISLLLLRDSGVKRLLRRRPQRPLPPRPPLPQRRRLTLSRSPSSNRISFSVAPNHSVLDAFDGYRLQWTHHVDTVQDSLDEKRSFTLRLPKRHRHAILSPYLAHVSSSEEEFERVPRERRFFTNNNGSGSFESGWVSVPFSHPSTFETLALEPELKKQIKQDLTAFANGKSYKDFETPPILLRRQRLRNPNVM